MLFHLTKLKYPFFSILFTIKSVMPCTQAVGYHKIPFVLASWWNTYPKRIDELLNSVCHYAAAGKIGTQFPEWIEKAISSWLRAHEILTGCSRKGRMLKKSSLIQSINWFLEEQGVKKEAACQREEYDQGLGGRQDWKTGRKKLKCLQKPKNSTMKLF